MKRGGAPWHGRSKPVAASQTGWTDDDLLGRWYRHATSTQRTCHCLCTPLCWRILLVITSAAGDRAGSGGGDASAARIACRAARWRLTCLLRVTRRRHCSGRICFLRALLFSHYLPGVWRKERTRAANAPADYGALLWRVHARRISRAGTGAGRTLSSARGVGSASGWRALALLVRPRRVLEQLRLLVWRLCMVWRGEQATKHLKRARATAHRSSYSAGAFGGVLAHGAGRRLCWRDGRGRRWAGVAVWAGATMVYGASAC